MIHYIDICPTVQKQVDFLKVRDAGFRAVLIKSSQYSSTRIHAAEQYVKRAEGSGLLCGHYHYAYCGADPEKQAEFFYDAARGHGSLAGQLPPVLDLEYGLGPPVDGAEHPIPPQRIVEWAVVFLRRATKLWYPLHELEGEAGRVVRKPKIYLFPAFAKKLQPYLSESELTQYDLHFACYYGDPKHPETLAWMPGDVGRPTDPWNVPTGMRCTDWQYSGNHGRPVPGIPGWTDRNVFLGDETQWQMNLGLIKRPVHSTEYGVKDDTVTRP
jgi:Glycosyl hydrolases family 25